MTATLKINFDDGSSKEITLHKAIEMRVGPERKQSIEFRETSDGTWVMAFTSPLFESKKFSNIEVFKND